MNILNLLLLITIATFVFVNSTKKRPTHTPQLRLLPPKLMIRLDHVDLCDGLNSKLRPLREFKIELLSSSITTFSTKLEVLEDMGNFTKCIVAIDKCASSAATTCEKFETWRFGKEFCSMYSWKGQMWTSVVESFRPPFVCPFGKGTYTVDNATFDTSRLQTVIPIPLEKFYWKVRTEMHDHDLFSCWNFHVKFYRMRQ